MHPFQRPKQFALLAGLIVFGFCELLSAGEAPKLYGTKSDRMGVVVGSVEAVTGVCRVNRLGREPIITARERIFDHDVLKTKTSRMRVKLKTGFDLRLAENSTLELERIHFDDPAESILRFHGGTVRIALSQLVPLHRYVVKPSHALIRIDAPVDFVLIQTEGKDDFSLKVLSGRVTILSTVTSEQKTVEEKNGLYMKQEGSFSDYGPFSDSMKKYLEERTQM